MIAPGTPWSLMMQDWEAATAGLAVASMGVPHNLHLTLHNSFDDLKRRASAE